MVIMHYDDTIIQAYLHDLPISKTKYYKAIQGYHHPDNKRKDIVTELNQQLHHISDQFPVFNAHLWSLLFEDMDDYLDTITICPMVGSNVLSSRKVYNGKTYLFIDLIHTANYTRIVSQMTYILKNHLSYEITKLCILQKYPLTSHNYATLLDASTFMNGLAHFLAWNESCEQYQFHTDKYEPKKEKAFGLLAQAMQIENHAMQHKILTHIRSSDLWDQFPAVAGMFYFDDIYQEFGISGVLQLYRKGPLNFVQRIYE